MIWNGSVAVAPHKVGNYASSIGDASSWSGLCAHVVSSKAWWEKQAKEWMEESASEGHYIMMGAAMTLWLILFALEHVMNKIYLTLNTSLSVGFTVLDQLAQALYTGAAQSLVIADKVKKIIGGILKYVGHVLDTSVQLSVAFIRWVLETLFRVVSATALAAVHATTGT